MLLDVSVIVMVRVFVPSKQSAAFFLGRCLQLLVLRCRASMEQSLLRRDCCGSPAAASPAAASPAAASSAAASSAATPQLRLPQLRLPSCGSPAAAPQLRLPSCGSPAAHGSQNLSAAALPAAGPLGGSTLCLKNYRFHCFFWFAPA